MLKTSVCTVAVALSIAMTPKAVTAAEETLTAEAIEARALSVALEKFQPRGDGSKQARDNVAASLPDWNGVWENGGFALRLGTYFDFATGFPHRSTGMYAGERQHPPYKPEYEAKYRTYLARLLDGYAFDTFNYCLPAGFPRILNFPMAFEFIVTPEAVWMISEAYSEARKVYTDGRGHPPRNEIVPSWGGHSVGHWEGDTLVIDTVGVREPGMLDGFPDQILDRTAAFLSGEAQFIERMRKTEAGTIESMMVVYDPVTLTRPWVVRRVWTPMAPGSFVTDSYCAEARSAEGGERNPVVGGVSQMKLPNDPPGYVMKADQVKPKKPEPKKPESKQ